MKDFIEFLVIEFSIFGIAGYCLNMDWKNTLVLYVAFVSGAGAYEFGRWVRGKCGTK